MPALGDCEMMREERAETRVTVGFPGKCTLAPVLQLAKIGRKVQVPAERSYSLL